VKMIPNLATDDEPDVHVAHSVLSAQRRPVAIASGETFTDGSDRVIRELAGVDPVAASVPALSHHVAVVVGWVSDKEVAGIHARGIVTMMADKSSRGDWPVEKNPRKTVGLLCPAHHVEPAVSTNKPATNPFPAFVGAFLRSAKQTGENIFSVGFHATRIAPTTLHFNRTIAALLAVYPKGLDA
jgi:hypothetical protein